MVIFIEADEDIVVVVVTTVIVLVNDASRAWTAIIEFVDGNMELLVYVETFTTFVVWCSDAAKKRMNTPNLEQFSSLPEVSRSRR